MERPHSARYPPCTTEFVKLTESQRAAKRVEEAAKKAEEAAKEEEEEQEGEP